MILKEIEENLAGRSCTRTSPACSPFSSCLFLLNYFRSKPIPLTCVHIHVRALSASNWSQTTGQRAHVCVLQQPEQARVRRLCGYVSQCVITNENQAGLAGMQNTNFGSQVGKEPQVWASYWRDQTACELATGETRRSRPAAGRLGVRESAERPVCTHMPVWEVTGDERTHEPAIPWTV